MGRWWFACCLWLGSSLCLAAPVPPGTYAGKLLEEVTRANPQVLGAAISAAPPKAAAAVVVAATEPAAVGAAADPADLAASKNGATTSVPNAAGDRLEVRLPLRDVSGDTVGAAPYGAASFTQNSGASLRLVLDVGAWDNSVAMNSPGQSGDLASPHYADLYQAWARGENVPLLYTRERVEAVAEHRLVLQP